MSKKQEEAIVDTNIEQSGEVIEEVQEKKSKPRKVSERTKKRNAITFEYMVDYIEKNVPQDKEWFKGVAFELVKGEDGEEKHVYKHFAAKKAFIDRYMPELSAKEKKSKWDMVAEW